MLEGKENPKLAEVVNFKISEDTIKETSGKFLMVVVTIMMLDLILQLPILLLQRNKERTNSRNYFSKQLINKLHKNA